MAKTNNLYGDQITIDVVRGGFILQYPMQVSNPETFPLETNGPPGMQTEPERWETAREVFTSPRKLNQKLKEIIEQLGFVKDEK